MPPCMGEADRFSLEALRHIHKQLDDDNDGGIEVNESVEVSAHANHDMVTSPLTKSLASVFNKYTWVNKTERSAT